MISNNSVLKRAWPMVIQCAYAHRKPLWLPVAKSKIYRIPKRPEISEEERLELMRVNNNYKAQMRAIRRFFYEHMIREKSTLESSSSEMSQQLEADEWKRCVELNEQWNAHVSVEREERRNQDLIAMEEYALARIDAEDKKRQARIAAASEHIRREKELSFTFVNVENLDAAIDHALANPTDYNFAIDLHGQQYEGSSSLTSPQENQKATLQSELSFTFVNVENLDAAIDHALANPTDYNFAIDLHGQQYEGSSSLTSPQENQKATLQSELSFTFVNVENLDAAIDHALANPTDYNFAIDLHGQQYEGSSSLTSPQENQKATLQSVIIN